MSLAKSTFSTSADSANDGNSENFYDLPIIPTPSNTSNTSNRLDDVLFDDPNYKRGFVGQRHKSKGNSASSDDIHMYHTLEPPPATVAEPSAAAAASSAASDNRCKTTQEKEHFYHTLEPPAGANASQQKERKKRQHVSYENIVLKSKSSGSLEDVQLNIQLHDSDTPWYACGSLDHHSRKIKSRNTGYENVTLEPEGAVLPQHAESRIVGGEGDKWAAVGGRGGGVERAKKANVNYENVVLGGESSVPVSAASGAAEESQDGEPASAMARARDAGRVGCAVSLGQQPAGKISNSVNSLSLLDYQESELMELDPDITSCLLVESQSEGMPVTAV